MEEKWFLVPLFLIIISLSWAQDANTYIVKGEQLIEKGEYDAAIKQFQRALELDPNSQRAKLDLKSARLIRAGIYLSKRKYDEAIEEYRNVLALNPKDPQAQFNLGVAYMWKEDWKRAEAELERVLALKPDMTEPEGAFIVSSTYNALGKIAFKKRDYNKALANYQRALQIHPENGDAHYNLGELYEKREEYEKAIREYKLAISINEYDIDSYIRLSNLYYTKRMYREGISTLKSLLNIQPNDVGAHYNLGNFYYRAGDKKAALMSWFRVSMLSPRGDYAKFANKFIFDTVMELKQESEDPALLAFLDAWLSIKDGDYEASLERYKRAVEMDRTNAVASIMLAEMHIHLGNYALAVDTLERTAELNPLFAPIYNDLGIAYGHLGKIDMAIEAYKRAINVAPNMVEIYANLGKLYNELGRSEEAIETLEEAVRQDPDFALAHLYLGDAYSQKKDYGNALYHWRKVVDLAPGSDLASLARRYMDKIRREPLTR
ncbi:MAG: tetratricopeptide repeat protein [bacterium]